MFSLITITILNLWFYHEKPLIFQINETVNWVIYWLDLVGIKNKLRGFKQLNKGLYEGEFRK